MYALKYARYEGLQGRRLPSLWDILESPGQSFRLKIASSIAGSRVGGQAAGDDGAEPAAAEQAAEGRGNGRAIQGEPNRRDVFADRFEKNRATRPNCVMLSRLVRRESAFQLDLVQRSSLNACAASERKVVAYCMCSFVLIDAELEGGGAATARGGLRGEGPGRPAPGAPLIP